MDIRKIEGSNPDAGGRPVSVKDLLERLNENLEFKKKRQETASDAKKWKLPFKWKGKAKAANKAIDRVLVFYLNIKGELEPPMVQPLYSGNMVIIRHKPYEVDPRAFWTLKIGMKQYKLLIIKEIDRRPVSNLDYTEIKRRGDSTDSDEFLIKAALRAQTSTLGGKSTKMIVILLVLAVVGAGIYYFMKS